MGCNGEWSSRKKRSVRSGDKSVRSRSHKALLVVLTLTLDIDKQPRLNGEIKVYLFMAQHIQQPGSCIALALVV